MLIFFCTDFAYKVHVVTFGDKNRGPRGRIDFRKFVKFSQKLFGKFLGELYKFSEIDPTTGPAIFVAKSKNPPEKIKRGVRILSIFFSKSVFQLKTIFPPEAFKEVKYRFWAGQNN